MNVGKDETGGRSWEDCRRYGFISSGGTDQLQQHARALRVGDQVFAYLSGHGYVGVGEVIADAVPQKDFIPVGESTRLVELPVTAQLRQEWWESPVSDWCVAMRWTVALPREEAVLRARFRRPTFRPYGSLRQSRNYCPPSTPPAPPRSRPRLDERDAATDVT